LLLGHNGEALKAHFPILGQDELEKVTLKDTEVRSSLWLKLRESFLGGCFETNVLSIITNAKHLVLAGNSQEGEQ